jgi:CheY-like chemotaxis protein
VLSASSGESARRILESAACAPEAILVDWGLAGGETGLEVIRGIRARLGAEIPAVVITGDTSPERLAKIQASGLALLSKPVSPMRLRALLNRLLG